MPGGYMELIAMGGIDQYIIASPQISYFKSVYKLRYGECETDVFVGTCTDKYTDYINVSSSSRWCRSFNERVLEFPSSGDIFLYATSFSMDSEHRGIYNIQVFIAP
jgi:hypothetical protein